MKCIDQNNEIIKLVLKDVNDMFQNKSKEEPDDTDSLKINDDTETDIELMNPRLNLDVDRVYTTLKQIGKYYWMTLKCRNFSLFFLSHT